MAWWKKASYRLPGIAHLLAPKTYMEIQASGRICLKLLRLGDADIYEA